MDIIQKRSLIIFVFSLLLFVVYLPPEFIAFQTRFGLFAQEMFRHGISFFPQTYMGNYPDYPVSSTVVIYLISLLFGHVSPFTAILPTAIISSLTLVLIYQIGALENEALGIYAVLFALLTQYFIEESRTISIDQYITFFTALGFYLIYSADLDQQFKRLWFLPIILLLGFAFRGPIGLVIPAGVLGGYYLYRKEYTRFLKFGALAMITFMLGLMILLILAYWAGGKSFVQTVLSMQIFNRIHDPNPDIFYYFTTSFFTYFLSFPVAIIVIIARWKKIIYPKTSLDRLVGTLTLWFLIILVGMTIPAAKKARYILPMVPAISLLSASVFVESGSQLQCWIKKCILGFCMIFPYLAALLSLSSYFYVSYYHLPFKIIFVNTTLIFIFLILASIFLTQTFKGKNTFIKLLMAALSFVIFNISIGTTIQYHHEKTKPFTDYFLMLQNQQPRDLVFYQDGPDGDDIKFMVNLNQPIKPIFIDSIDQLLRYQKPAYFITKKEVIDQMPIEQKKQMTILYEGKIGHRPSMIFEPSA